MSENAAIELGPGPERVSDPTRIVTTLAMQANAGAGVRVHLADGLDVPVEPDDGLSSTVESVAIESFDAAINRVTIEPDEGGLLMGTLRIPLDEWHRTKLDRQWESEEVTMHGDQREIELHSARYINHPPENGEPFSRPTLHVRRAKTLRGHERGGMFSTEIGTIAALEVLADEDARLEHQAEPESVTYDLSDWGPSADAFPDSDDPIPATQDTLEALYVANKHAKRFADEARNAYAAGDGAGAKENSVRKKALYRLKTHVLTGMLWHPETDATIERHELNDEPFACFRLGGWSFHQPLREVHRDHKPENDDSEARTVKDYNRSGRVEHSELSLGDALSRFAALGSGCNANNHLEQDSVSDGWGNSWSIKWPIADPDSEHSATHEWSPTEGEP